MKYHVTLEIPSKSINFESLTIDLLGLHYEQFLKTLTDINGPEWVPSDNDYLKEVFKSRFDAKVEVKNIYE